MADCVSSQRFFRLPRLPTLSFAAESSESVLAAEVDAEADPPPTMATEPVSEAAAADVVVVVLLL